MESLQALLDGSLQILHSVIHVLGFNVYIQFVLGVHYILGVANLFLPRKS